ncbi:MAG TPA: glyoxalase [Pusillimonas sp.]|jgi:catechol 2,3-dioxygenase-like lactoylglutathione lyase family enzyme|nr:glyoxalase [Pusillimonas sp.]|tara:strand:- start:66392 stop:67258 length:867 start_codon:yes stop_codon:yes gene_type:complete
MNTAPNRLVLKGVDHTARPTWKLKETVEFYRDKLGLPLIHTISARGWGPSTHPDFLHFFFDSGQGSTIAFFYYLGTQAPQAMHGREHAKPWPEDFVTDATHTAWLVDSVEELSAWKERLQAKGVEVSVETRHEVIESIYFRDPNGYFLEISRKLRPLDASDYNDAARTLNAAIELETERQGGVAGIASIDEVWHRKAARLLKDAPANTVCLPVLKVPEFDALVQAAKEKSDCNVTYFSDEYWLIQSSGPIEFGRKALGLKPALWYGLFTSGLHGKITVFDRDIVRIEP